MLINWQHPSCSTALCKLSSGMTNHRSITENRKWNGLSTYKLYSTIRNYDGAPSKNITMARRKGQEWFVAAMTNNEGSEEEIPLTFLDKEKNYLACIYTDGEEKIKTNTQVKCTYLLVNASQTMQFQLKPSGGAAIRLVPIDRQEMKKYKKYKGERL